MKKIIYVLIIGVILIMMSFPLMAKERVICEVDILSENNAKIKLKWNDESKSTPIRISGWTLIENQGLKVIYEIGDTIERGWDERKVEANGYEFPVKIFLEENGKERTGFIDMPESEEVSLSILNLYDRGIISGYSDEYFQPKKKVSRAEFAKMIFLTAGYPLSNAHTVSFKDVSNSFWGRDYILELAQKGILKGRQEGVFDPNGSISLGEVLAVIDRTFLFYNESVDYGETLEKHWSNENFRSLVSAGIVKKTDSFYSSYQPNEKASREQCALLLSRVLETFLV